MNDTYCATSLMYLKSIISKFLGKKGHHHPAMGPVSNSVPPPCPARAAAIFWLPATVLYIPKFHTFEQVFISKQFPEVYKLQEF